MKKMHSILTVILSFALALGLCPVHSFAEDAAVKSWKDLYSELGVTASAEEGYYDAVSSATSFSSRHAGDIPDVVHRVTDADGKTTALDGVVLPGAQVNVTPALGSTDYTDSSSYGTDELVIYPDDTVEGYVWNNYLKAMYAVTVSDGTTTVGALPWIDFYGEQATSGFHYNKIQVALNSGTSVGKNKAVVHRYDAFYENGSVKPGDYTVTVYADGFAPLTATVTVPTLPGKLDKDIKAADTYVANKDNYTEASYAAFEEALTKAKEVAAKDNATDEEITGARKALSEAEGKLVTKVNQNLNDAIEAAASISNEDGTYTAESFQALQDALAAAQTIAANRRASDAQKVEATAALQNAIDALVKTVPEDPSEGTTETPAETTTASTGTTKSSAVQVTKVTITGISKKIAAGKSIKLTAALLPKNASNKKVTWTSSDKKVATVNAAGLVKTKKNAGGKTVKITATAKDSGKKKAVYKIKVMKGKVTKVTLKAKAKKVKAGKSLKLTATVKTSKTKPVNKTLKWTSSNTKYATVNNNGLVKAKEAGKGKTVKITVQSTDGTNKKKSVKIKIN